MAGRIDKRLAKRPAGMGAALGDASAAAGPDLAARRPLAPAARSHVRKTAPQVHAGLGGTARLADADRSLCSDRQAGWTAHQPGLWTLHPRPQRNAATYSLGLARRQPAGHPR